MRFWTALLALAACQETERTELSGPVGIVVSSSEVELTEGTTMAVEITLDQRPVGDLTVQVAATGAATVSPMTLTFTTSNFDASQLITISSARDLDLVDAAGAVELTGADTGASIAVSIHDADVQSIISTVPSVTVTEGQSATFMVVLAFAPSSETTIAVASLNPAIAGVTPSALTFTPASYATPQLVTVTAADDMNLATDTTQARLSATGVGMTDISIDVLDDDQQRIVLTATTLSIPEAGSNSVGVSLAYDPGTNVAVNVSSDNQSVLPAFPAILQFNPANYAVPKTVAAYSGQDRNGIDETATITLVEPLTSATATFFATIDDMVAREAYGWPTLFDNIYTPMNAGPVIAFQITVTQPGLLDTLGLFLSTGSYISRIALYHDSGGTPGALVSGADTRLGQVVGHNFAIINPVALSSGSYWIALRVSGSTLVNESGGSATTSVCVRNVEIPDIQTPFPATFGAATCQTGYAYNVYIDTLL